MRHNRIITDEERNVSLREVVRAAHPFAIAFGREDLSRLVQSDRRKEVFGADGLRQAHRGHHRRAVLVAARTHEECDRIGAVFVDYPAEFIADMGQRILHRGFLKLAIFIAHQRMVQTIFRIV